MLLRRHHQATAPQPERAPRHRAAEPPPTDQDTETPTDPPAGNASREQWADYRVTAGHLNPDQAAAMSRDDLRDYTP